jgi:hypothetical protein
MDVPQFAPNVPPAQDPQGMTIPESAGGFVTVTERPTQLFNGPQSTATVVVVSTETIVATTDDVPFTTT